MTTDPVQQFITKWQRSALNEKAIAQEHFIDLCRLLDVPTPNEADPTGEFYRFEKPLTKSGGGAGFADVWYRGRFAWEYKTPGKSLNLAYQQLLLYKEDLDNPPVLVVSDIKTYEVHIVYTGYKTRIETFTNADLQHTTVRELLSLVFTNPAELCPQERAETVTEKAAWHFAKLASSLEGRGYTSEEIAPFFMKLLFALFAEDIGILPGQVLTRYIQSSRASPQTFPEKIISFFHILQRGGYFGMDDRFPQIDGWLYNDDHILELDADELQILSEAADLDWRDIEPTIFGTLFERSIDPSKRSQLGLHYTSKDDILLIVEPVVMVPLRREWHAVQQRIAEIRPEWDSTVAQLEQAVQAVRSKYDTTGSFFHIAEEQEIDNTTLKRKQQRLQNQLEGIILEFIERLSEVRILDPACGSGNFLYVALHQMKDLEKEVITYATGLGLHEPALGVTPAQFYGIEKNPFAAELAQVVIWIGYLQWRRMHGFWNLEEPVLRSLQTVTCQDAILTFDTDGNPQEPAWTPADFVIGNPPYLGTKKMRFELEDHVVNALHTLYQERVPREADLVIYWFERARAYIEQGSIKRAGLLATQGIRGGANRKVLDRIKETGDIFMAWSDRDWILDGATVHISMICFDNGSEQERLLNGNFVTHINPNLTTSTDVTKAQSLAENQGISFKGDAKQGPFNIDAKTAQSLMVSTRNPEGKSNSEVIRPWVNGMDIAGKSRGMWIIDFGLDMPEQEAKKYKRPFAYVKKHVKPEREKRVRDWYREQWWLHYAPRRKMRQALATKERFIATPSVSKHRLFVWLQHPTLPDQQLIVFARDDDYFFGVLHSKVHELWTRSLATQLREMESGTRYTPTTCFETFPLPWAPGKEPRTIYYSSLGTRLRRQTGFVMSRSVRKQVQKHAHHLTRNERKALVSQKKPHTTHQRKALAKKIPAKKHVTDNPLMYAIAQAARELVEQRDAWLHPTDALVNDRKQRTLTNLYNLQPDWLRAAHRKLDVAVLRAYGWSPDLYDEEILEKLLEENLKRAGK